jgi:NADH-quinone oxidoreductase subunit N
VSFETLIENLRSDTLKVSLPGFLPELVLSATIVLMLLARLPNFSRRLHSFYIALGGSVVALFFTAPWGLRSVMSNSTVTSLVALVVGASNEGVQGAVQALPNPLVPTELFGGLLIYDTMTVYFRAILILFAILFLFFTWLSGIPDREDSVDFYTLFLGATIGMCLMASANHLFIVFLGVEMASVPSYALAGMLKGRRKSSEAALKYSVYGAGTAGVMLYGISLLAGALGSLHLPTMADQLAGLSTAAFADRQTVLMLGGLMLAVGLAFKLSAVPFHFWCPDVFEGASAEVDAFLSVASKAAALALLLRVVIGFGHPSEPLSQELAHADAQHASMVLTAASSTTAPVMHTVQKPAVDDKSHAAAEAINPLARARHYMLGLVSLLAAITCTFGNLAAYGQTNIKRLLAYSTIAHAGYMMMAVAAAVAVMGRDSYLAEQAVGALCFYVAVYLFMNLGAFAVVAFLRNIMHSEEIADYAGLIRSCPGVVICMSIILVSLLGLPPLSGFVAKFAVFSTLVTDPQLYPLLIVGGLNTVLSLFYYLRLVKIMALDPEPPSRLPISFSLVSAEGVFIVLVTVPVAVLGVWWDPLNRWAQAAAKTLLS